MKNFALITVLLLFTISSFAQRITRGPEIGEIYLLGPTTTVLNNAIYRSTDFGGSLICVDSISQSSHTIGAILADKSLGGLYFSDIVESLFYSDNFGQYGSWEYKNSNIYSYLLGGRKEGHIYEYMVSHSDDYGNTFINHNLNGFFGAMFTAEIDNQDSVGYVVTEKWGEWDTLFILITHNDFEDMQLQNKFYRYEEPIGRLSRGYENGELFTLIPDKTTIRYSDDYGYSWNINNKLYLNNYTSIDFTGGRQNGEVYLLVTYVKQMGDIKHIYIYHSLDYGESFTVHHPFSFGSAPFFIGFDAETKTGIVPLNVQFTNESSGEDLNYAWDFNNDGIYDSYEQDPAFVYPDTGHHAVKLKVTNPDNNDSITKYSYIYVKDTTTLVENKKQFGKIKIYPIPAINRLFVELPCCQGEGSIEIFDVNGRSIMQRHEIELQNEFDIGYMTKGIYIIRITFNNNHQYHKFIKN